MMLGSLSSVFILKSGGTAGWKIVCRLLSGRIGRDTTSKLRCRTVAPRAGGLSTRSPFPGRCAAPPRAGYGATCALDATRSAGSRSFPNLWERGPPSFLEHDWPLAGKSGRVPVQDAMPAKWNETALLDAALLIRRSFQMTSAV